MSQLTHSRLPIPSQLVSTRAAWMAALLALVASAAIVLVIALGDGAEKAAPASVQSQPSLRADAGPEESGVAAAVGSRPAPAPSESAIAASIGTATPQGASSPDESRVAAAITAAR